MGIEIMLLALIGVPIGIWLFRDANRLNARVKVAEAMMSAWVTEAEAMETSGCNWWERPWYQRILTSPPTLPVKEH